MAKKNFSDWLAELTDEQDHIIRLTAMTTGRSYIEQAEREFKKTKGLGRFL